MSEWSMATLRRLHARHVGGETLAEIGQSVGITPQAVHGAFTRAGLTSGLGLGHDRREGLPKGRAAMLRHAWALRMDGALWREIAEQVGWPGSTGSLNAAALRYARRVGVVNRRGEDDLRVGKTTAAGFCRIRGCTRRVRARGLCGACYNRARRRNLLPVVAEPPTARSVSAAGAPVEVWFRPGDVLTDGRRWCVVVAVGLPRGRGVNDGCDLRVVMRCGRVFVPARTVKRLAAVTIDRNWQPERDRSICRKVAHAVESARWAA